MGFVKNEKEAENLKLESTKVTKKERFPLAKWESNIVNINEETKR